MEKLKSALESERKGLLSFRGEELAKVHLRLEEAASRCLSLETERKELLSDIATLFGQEASQITSSLLAKVLEPNLGKKLSGFANHAKRAASDLQVEIRVGTELLCWSARCHEGVIRELAASANGDVPTYGKNGRKKRNKRRSGFLDARF
jgi:hypothetical protein